MKPTPVPNHADVRNSYDPHHPISLALNQLLNTIRGVQQHYQRTQADADADLAAVEQAWAVYRHEHSAITIPAQRLGHAPVIYDAPPVKQPDYIHAFDELTCQDAWAAAVGSGMLLTLVAAYDTFLGALLRGVHKVQPELLKGSDKSLTFVDIVNLTPPGDVDAARGLFIEREVEDLLHRGHSDQLTHLARRVGLETLGKFKEFGDFIELTERRNLLAHGGGRVSVAYLTKTKNHPAAAGLKPGDYISVDPTYIEKACHTLTIVGTLLAHTVWRKIAREPKERAAADRDLAQLTYVLLVREHWALAQRLLSFAVDCDHSSEPHKLVFHVNLAQAYKWLGQQAACDGVLDRIDWTAKDVAFQLSNAVLRDDFDEAAQLMHWAATTEQVDRTAFDHWPIYRQFRLSRQYRDTYRRCYNAEPPAQHDLISEAGLAS